MIISGAMALLLFGSCHWLRPERQPDHLLLSEVVPQSRIVSEEEGIIEYQGTTYLLGRKDLGRKKFLIDSLDLLNPEAGEEIDLRFNGQVIIRKKKEAGD